MTRTLTAALLLGLPLGLLVAGCNTGSRSKKTPGAAAAGATATASTTPQPGAVNVLTSGAPSAAPSGASSATPSSATSAASSSATAAPASSGAVAGAPAGATPIAPAAANPNQPQIWGTIPPDPSTGFDGTLYLVGEKLVPGSVISVEVNGVWSKFLPATFHSSELLGFYVYLTVPADYTFTAVAPDGTQSTPVQLTVPNGGPAALVGLEPPVVHMAYPPSLDTNFAGTVWLMGEKFMPGSVALVSVGNLPPLPMPLVFLNERTVGLVTATPFAGDVTIQVSNPTLFTSRPVTLTVGQAAAPAGPATAPVFSAPAAVASPFVGSVHLTGTDLFPGATVELRAAGTTATLSTTPLVWVSTQEAWWTLVYPAAGNYELRVVNPGGAAAPWTPFTVN